MTIIDATDWCNKNSDTSTYAVLRTLTALTQSAESQFLEQASQITASSDPKINKKRLNADMNENENENVPPKRVLRDNTICN